MNIVLILELSIAVCVWQMALGIIRPKYVPLAFDGTSAHGRARYLAAALSIVAGLALLIGTALPILTFFAAIIALAVLIGFWLIPSIRLGGWRWFAPAIFSVAAIGVACLQPLGLKVMMLPKADKLPYEPVPAMVVKTYAEGLGFESVRAGPNGTLYLGANIGLDFNRADYYRHAQGQIIARSQDGRERVRFTTPIGNTAGVTAIAADGTIFMTSNGTTSGIWRIKPDGAASMFVRLPTGAWPNGLDFGPDGMLYTPDSALAVIWRIDPRTGHYTQALADKALAARRFIALAPGANGLHFSGWDMIVTVCDAAKVLKYKMDSVGHFGAPVTIASGIPGDDFAVGRDGSLFITTHPYNTLVWVSPTGRRSIIGDARQNIIGATDATFGRGPQDQDTLYVATDGGAFTAGPSARGQLVALKVAGLH